MHMALHFNDKLKREVKMRYLKYLVAATVIFLLNQSFCFASNNETLADLVNSKSPIKVYLSDFTNESGKDEIKAEEFKAEVEKAMLNRKSVKFEIVKDPAVSDVQVSCSILKCQYLERGPFKPSIGLETMALDAAATMTLNYVEMLNKFTILDTKSGRILWQDEINEYVKRKMTPEQSLLVIYDKTARVFLWKSFGKPSR